MEDDKYIKIIFAIIIIGILFFAFNSETDNPYGEGCYDADPTQYVDVICE